MDRLAGYYAWNDKQNLDQAVMVAKHHPIQLAKIKAWSKKEGEITKYETFITALKRAKQK